MGCVHNGHHGNTPAASERGAALLTNGVSVCPHKTRSVRVKTQLQVPTAMGGMEREWNPEAAPTLRPMRHHHTLLGDVSCSCLMALEEGRGSEDGETNRKQRDVYEKLRSESVRSSGVSPLRTLCSLIRNTAPNLLKTMN